MTITSASASPSPVWGGGGGPPPPVGPRPARPLLGRDGMDAAPLLLLVTAGCSPVTPASSSSPTSTAAAEARGAAPACHRSVAGRRFNSSPELSKGWRRLGFTAEGVRVLNGPSTGAREIFLRARSFTGSASSHTRPITRETADIIWVPELYGLR
jgi:hypothetical protein